MGVVFVLPATRGQAGSGDSDRSMTKHGSITVLSLSSPPCSAGSPIECQRDRTPAFWPAFGKNSHERNASRTGQTFSLVRKLAHHDRRVDTPSH